MQEWTSWNPKLALWKKRFRTASKIFLTCIEMAVAAIAHENLETLLDGSGHLQTLAFLYASKGISFFLFPIEGKKLQSAEAVTACSWNELVLSSDVPVVVEFWTSWCGPCKMVSRVMKELAHEYSGRVRCFRIDADDYPQVAASHGVERIPTILVFKNAEKFERIIGTMPKSVYVAAIQKSLSQ
ncbi:thioredoxin M3, chloroplastic-like isoform X2 [Phalaenopsis equestris]|uniref:thioredoxin M3, chloroplastic-like isoform X2 n=1 Tax=Phalaenopsis equestris TaxID=78828 RepID=UPI0009E2EBF2|nr:thioredoxin M3, chloroplastic-like isoform X2 [Phalaenopsis equestris]